jgi:predicted lipoprotein with Yx(FWY)xxD motif
MKGRYGRRALVVVIVLGATAASAAATVGVTVKSWKSSALSATIVVNANGMTVYHYGVEPKNAVKCTRACASLWPPLLIAAGHKPVAGPGLTASKLGTVKRPDGEIQVTYGGFALYRYSGDAKAGDVNGQGVQGVWHAISSSGALVTTKAAVASTGGSSTTTTGGGGGYGYG